MGQSHPIALFFHWAFKIAGIVYYILCELLFSDSFVINFVVVIVLLAMDFWAIKNVTGRLLVGLRWWNEANDTGSAWRFESLPDGAREILPREKRLFWIGLLVGPVAWALLGLMSLFRAKFGYLILPIIGVIFTSSNLWGYFKCSKEAKSQLQDMSNSFVQGAIKQSISNAWNQPAASAAPAAGSARV